MIDISNTEWFKYLHNNMLNAPFHEAYDILLGEIKADPLIQEYTINRDHNLTTISLLRNYRIIYITIYHEGDIVKSFNMEVENNDR